MEIISIGNELLIGKIQNTNAFWLSKQATQLGVNVTRETTIPDIIDVIAQTLKETIRRKPQFIITTGGLGPTFDDKTFEAVAKALNRPLEVNPEALNFVKEKCETYAKKHGLPIIEMTPPRIKMAALPQGTQPINNPVGTAPGLRVDLESVMLFVLPGVPLEMEAIFNESIAPLLKSAVGELRFFERSLFADCIAEAALAPLIDAVMRDNAAVYLKSHPLKVGETFRVELHLTLSCSGDGVEKLQKAAGQLAKLIEQHGGKPSFNE
ncbi:MAG: molybdopterin-binding protein [Candidatus Bathyarchaeota archaeon]|nr:molybdopterin-binding protein [Candidatus Bathyarchaeota archaeon]